MSDLEAAPAADFPLNEPTYVRVKRAFIRDLFARAFTSGTHITIEMLTSRYGVGHMPVREALRQLEGEGVLRSTAHKGFRIALLTPRYIRNVYDVRIGVESLLARRAVENATDLDVATLENIHRRFLVDLTSKDKRLATNTNIEFHARLYELAENPEAMEVIDGRTLVVRTFGSTLSGYRDVDRPLVAAEHQAIIDAVVARNPVAAAQAVFDHVTVARERLVERLIETGVIAAT